MQNHNQQLVIRYMSEIWNNRNFSFLDAIVHPDFKDNSLPESLPPTKDGLVMWVKNTGKAFEHKTIIEDHVTEGDKSIVKIRMLLKHIGLWRHIESTELEIETTGYRFFKIKDGKIIEHSALIDGQTIENQLRNASHGCKISQ